MKGRRLSVRASRMELEFALVQGDRQKIEEAEKNLAEALAEAAKSRAPESDDEE